MGITENIALELANQSMRYIGSKLSKDYERFVVQSKKPNTIFDVNVAVENLEFHVYVTSEYFCHGVLKKRGKLHQNVENLQKSLRINYATCLKEVGLVFQPKNSLEFELEEASTRRSQLLIFAWK